MLYGNVLQGCVYIFSKNLLRSMLRNKSIPKENRPGKPGRHLCIWNASDPQTILPAELAEVLSTLCALNDKLLPISEFLCFSGIPLFEWPDVAHDPGINLTLLVNDALRTILMLS